MEYPNIEKWLIDNNEIEIIRAESGQGFLAILYSFDWDQIETSDKQRTVKEALERLEYKLSLKEDMSSKEDKNKG